MIYNINTVFKLLFPAVFLSITVTKTTSSEYLGTGKSFANEPPSAGSISPRFLDLGGVISQLFSGFNQGTPGGSTGLNNPSNSQFYPGVLGQGINPQPPLGFGNKWSNPNQGIIQDDNLIGGTPNQQLNRPPGSLNFNSPTVQRQGQLSKQAQDLAQILNIQNNNGPLPYSREPKGNSRLQRSDSPRSQSFTFDGDQHGAIELRNEGTLEDFFTTEGPGSNNNDHRIMFPNHNDDDIRTTTKNSVWGKQVQIPTTTPSSDRIVFLDDSETPYQKQCVQNCPTTSEYNPVCGSDSVTYFNPGRLLCARNCGINVRQRRPGSCKSN